MQAQETLRRHTAIEKLPVFPLQELRNAPSALLRTSKKRLEMLGHHP